jgi:N-methylhydantoinase A
MEQAIRLISVERGYDPHDFALFCFGGAGGLHAASLAQGLDIPRVVVPQYPGALSALGLLLADARKDYSRTLLVDVEEGSKKLHTSFAELHRLGASEMKAEGFKPRDVRTVDSVDLRYRGQSYELTIPFTSKFVADFHKTHERRYGYANPDKKVEIVNARTTLLGRVEKPQLQKSPRSRQKPVPLQFNSVWIAGKKIRTAIYDRDSLAYGHEIKGPAIIGEYSSTTLVPPGLVCRVDPFLNLVLERS